MFRFSERKGDRKEQTRKEEIQKEKRQTAATTIGRRKDIRLGEEGRNMKRRATER